MLPKSYYGSFDLVLVDLSQTILDMSVTGEMDIMMTLSLLLKPNGILVKNEEEYFTKIGETFKHVINIQIDDVPKICEQNFILGSDGIEFLRVPQKNHNIETLLNLYPQSIDSNSTFDISYDLVKDYRRNNTSPFVSMKQRNGSDEPKGQENSPGILMILETEDISIDLKNINQFSVTIIEAVSKKGFGFISHQIKTLNADSEEKATVVFIMNEGYIVVRVWPKIKYCAFDIHLWSSFEKLSSIENAITVATGSNDISSFRIIAGGIFGISTWKDDLTIRGPEPNQYIGQDIETNYAHSMPLEDSFIDYLLRESLELIPGDDLKIGIICGEKNKPCKSLDVLSKCKTVGEIIVIWSCTELQSCENEVSSILRKSTAVKYEGSLQSYNENHTFAIGDRVKSNYWYAGYWYPAIIQYVHVDGTADIKYENGSMEFMKDPHSIYHRIEIDTLNESTTLRSIYIDSSASPETWNIVKKLHDDVDSRENIFSNHATFINVVPIYEGGSENTLFEPINYAICEENYPLFNADIVFHHFNDGSAKMLVASSGDRHFVDRIKNFAFAIEDNSDNLITFEMNHVLRRKTGCSNEELAWQFSSKDYDQTSALNQWNSQKPLGHQTIFQLEIATFKSVRQPLNEDDQLEIGDQVFIFDEDYNEWYSGEIGDDTNEGDANYNVVSQWFEDDDVPRHNLMKNVRVPMEDSEVAPLSIDIIKEGASAICNSVSQCKSLGFANIGKGSTNVIQFESGVIIVLWDGNCHVDINVFTFFELSSFHEDIVDLFLEQVPSLQISLQDTHPRGIGHVVNFATDLKLQDKPLWA